jgi:hypothetical protein
MQRVQASLVTYGSLKAQLQRDYPSVDFNALGDSKTNQQAAVANQNATVLGIVSRDGGYTKKKADVCINFCPADASMITPIAESLQAVFWHYLVNKL